ncbi:MAG: lysine-2,3-aminomutase-like protein [Bdellovibrio sp.]
MLNVVDTQTDWQQEFREAVRKVSELEAILETKIASTDYPLFIPRQLAFEIKKAGKDSPLWKQFVPNQDENHILGMEDPIGDLAHLKKGQLIHRYKNRALFMPTSICPVLCRYCFRKNELNQEKQIFQSDLKETKKYLEDHPEINEIIFSGGDPLILSDEKIDQYLDFFSNIKSIKYIRFHSRTPIILPSRINESFISLLEKWSKQFIKITIVVHLNHLSELTDDNQLALQRLCNLPLQLLSQSVLLKDINDDEVSLKQLFEALIRNGIRPYYLHHPDQVKGGMHFSISLEKGRMIYAKLRDQLPGWAIPQYIIDIPGGFGKTPAFNPEHLHFTGQFIDRDFKNHQISLNTLDKY